MESFGTTFVASLQEIRKNFFAIAGLNLLNAFVAFLPLVLFPNSSFLGLLYFIPMMIFQTWSFIAIYQVITQNKFDLKWQIRLFQDRFWKWLWACLATLHLIFRAVFPFVFPAVLKMSELLMVNSLILFGQDDRIDVLKKSSAMLKGQVWHMLGFLILFGGVLPQGLAFLARKMVDSSFHTPILIISSGLAGMFTTSFFVTLYNRRSPKIEIAPEETAVDYKQIALENLPRATLGFAWLILVVIILAVLGVMAFKGP